MEGTSDDELPDLATLLPPPAVSVLGRRQSPRKAPQSGSTNLKEKQNSRVSVTASRTQTSPTKLATAVSVKKTSQVKPPAFSLGNVPVLPRQGSRTEASASSNNGLARSPPMRSMGLTHVDSLLLPLSKICLDEEARPKHTRKESRGLAASKSTRLDVAQKSKRSDSRMERSTVVARKFVLSEAACADDFENSLMDEDEDVDTDLSGFVVDDEVEPSMHESSSDSEVDRRARRKSSISPRRRRLQRGSRPRKNAETLSLDTESKEMAPPNDGLADAFRDMKIEKRNEEKLKQDIEIIDLTSSPVRTRDNAFKANVNTEEKFYGSVDFREPGNPINLFNDFDAIMKFSPPRPNALLDVPSQLKMRNLTLQGAEENDMRTSEVNIRDGFTTPPTTPPRSPSKLKSPSKVLSPSKRAAQIQHSPHRQSIDGFWDLEVVNTWNDTYSPKKAPIISPRKNHFLEWMDSGDEDEETPTGLANDTSDSLPSPCSSPRKSKSPQRSPEKAEKRRALEEKRAARAKKQDFDFRKEDLATSLIADLDTNITSSKLSTLSATTGGVQIIWSKTLRSTAGRANWRRTIVKASGSPVKGTLVPEGSNVQHYASIELATKVVDCETRLVNTLAHEFCHLANFMVSSIRDQPHGASFKAWAMKVTKYLRAHSNPIYRDVEVTTKHSYSIDHKYLWVCAGREALALLKNVPEVEDGCGAEYGRHSKSINTEKQRCGRCKGALLQVRPKPRGVDSKRLSPRKALFQRVAVQAQAEAEAVAEMVEIVDLSD